MADQTTEKSTQQAAAEPDTAQRPNVEVSVLGPLPGGLLKALMGKAGCGEGCDCSKKKQTVRAPSAQELADYMSTLEAYIPAAGDLVRLNAVGRKLFRSLPGDAETARIGRVLPVAMFEQGAESGRVYAKHTFDCTIVFLSTVEADGKEDRAVLEVFFNSEMLELAEEVQPEAEAA